MSVLPDELIPIFYVGKGSLWPRARQMICQDLLNEVKRRPNHTRVLLEWTFWFPLCVVALLFAPAKGDHVCVQANPSLLSGRLLLFVFFKAILFWACLPLLLASARVGFPLFQGWLSGPPGFGNIENTRSNILLASKLRRK